jgi:hypothetical protein
VSKCSLSGNTNNVWTCLCFGLDTAICLARWLLRWKGLNKKKTIWNTFTRR